MTNYCDKLNGWKQSCYNNVFSVAYIIDTFLKDFCENLVVHFET